MITQKAEGPAGGRVVALGLPALLATLLVAAWMLLAGAGPAEAATFTVNKTGDGGDRSLSDNRCDASNDNGSQCTLRAAIEEANDTGGADAIEFGIGSGSSVRTISPASELPTVTDPVTMDGYTQRGASPNTLSEGNDAVLKVELDGSDAGADTNGLVIRTPDSAIKGLVINDFEDDGLLIFGSDATGNRVEGNFVGTNEEGTTSEGNHEGVTVFGDSNTIGGTRPEQRNVISGNDDRGVAVIGSASEGNRVEGNHIGTTADGSADLGNAGDGVSMQGTNNAVGGIAGGAGNLIAHNGDDGVSVTFNNSAGNTVLSNSVFSNGSTAGDLGIDLDADGVTANDTDDPDAGANNLQNFPVLSEAIRSNATGFTTVFGTLNSAPSLDYVVQCFLTDGAPAPDHGEGPVLLDTEVVTTDANGDAAFLCHSFLPQVGQVPGQTVSATATDILTTGDTSELSLNVGVSAGL
jgi:hypothetical protein